jgi:hypothetical protein
MTNWVTTKLTPFAGTDLNWNGENDEPGVSAISSRIQQLDLCLVFMTSRAPECTCEKTEKRQEKRQVWLNGDSCAAAAQFP